MVVDNDALPGHGIDSVRSAEPSLPKDGIDKGEAYLLPARVVHVDADRLGSPERALVVAILGLCDPHLLGITKLLPLKLELLDLPVHPVVGRALHLTKRTLEANLVFAVQDAQNNNLAVHDLARVGGGELRHKWQPDRLHPLEEAVNIPHLVRGERVVVCWPTLSQNEKLGERVDLEALIELGIVGLDKLGMSNQAEREPLEGCEVLSCSSMVVKVDKDDLLHLLHFLQARSVYIGDTGGEVESILGVLDKVTKSPQAAILSPLTTFEEEDGGVGPSLDILA